LQLGCVGARASSPARKLIKKRGNRTWWTRPWERKRTGEHGLYRIPRRKCLLEYTWGAARGEWCVSRKRGQ
jgi:hypothetical protein